MSIWKSLMYRFEKEEIRTWTSLQKTAYLLLPLLLYLLVHDLAEILLWAGLELIMSTFGEGLRQFLVAHAYTVKGLVNGLAIIIGLAVIYKAVKAEIGSTQKEGIAEDSGKQIQIGQVTAYGFLTALAFLTAVGVNILFYQLGITQSSESFGQVQKSQFGVQFVAGLILYGIVSPIAEEAVFRGIIYNRMKRCFSYGVTLVVSSLLFGCYHGNLVQAIYGTLLGVLIAYVYEQFQSFSAPVVFHSAANISVFVMTYHEGLNELNRPAAIALAVVMLLAASGILFYLKGQVQKRQMKGKKK